MERRTSSPEATEALGDGLAPALRPGDLLALRGPLGAGKTCFVTGLARGLACQARVRSPTFTIVNVYHGRILLAHVDLYRVESADVAALGLEEYAERGALVIEWAERLPSSWTDEALSLELEAVDASTRRITAGARAGRGLDLLAAWAALPAPAAPAEP